VYYQCYRHEGVDYTRKKFFARLRLEPFGEGSIFPHERTFGGPKEDRLALTRATRANLSPIFGLYEDADNVIASALEPATRGTPLCVGTLDGVESRLWACSDATVIDKVSKLMQPKPVYIADGHHRYGTSLLYRDALRQSSGSLPNEHPANFVLCVLCAMEDPGLLILPTHRVLPRVGGVAAALRSDPELKIAPVDADSPDAAVRSLAQHGPQAVALWEDGSGYLLVVPKRPEILDSVAAEHSTAWRRLGLAFLHSYLLDRVVTPRCCAGATPDIQYVKAAGPAVEAARESSRRQWRRCGRCARRAT
jgi:uncharacterized protein (DUF1015 family)